MTDVTATRYCVIEMRSQRLGDLIVSLKEGGFDLRPLPSNKLPAAVDADYEICDDNVELSGEAGER